MTAIHAKKIDLRKQLKYLYSSSASKVQTVEVPQFNFMMIDGKGDPNRPEFSDAINALYRLSYTIKFAVKKEKATDYPVMPLEGLWWTDSSGFNAADRRAWKWTAMIMQPELVTPALFKKAVEEVRMRKSLKALPIARLEALHEGLSVQIMHIGPYSAEAPAITKLHSYIEENGGHPSGRHHEIYLGNPGRSAPSRLRTILRQPFEKSA